jgi:RNA polymerase sigma-70 factor (ECF subfamily)
VRRLTRPFAVVRAAAADTRHAGGLATERGLRAAYGAHGPELYRFALRQLGDQHAAQDIVQEVFLRAWRAADSFDPAVAGLRVWLFAIARNAVVDELRRSGARPWQRSLTADVDTASGAHRPVAGAFDETVIDTWVVEEALRRISAEHRSAIVQTHLCGRPYTEVAAELGVAVGTVRSRVFYGLKALRLAMEEMGVQP